MESDFGHFLAKMLLITMFISFISVIWVLEMDDFFGIMWWIALLSMIFTLVGIVALIIIMISEYNNGDE